MAYILQIISPSMDRKWKAFARLVNQIIVYHVFCDNWPQ